MKKIVRRRIVLDDVWQTSDLPPLLKNIYASRGVKSPDEVNHDLNQLLPFSKLKNINEAVDCLQNSLHKKERILIIGDYDADGATSTALVMLALKSFGFVNVNYLLPNRFEFGYGLTPEIVVEALKFKPDLIVTVDNGISSCDGVEKANQFGIKVLITDHHLPPPELPNAFAIVNPNQIDDLFPSKNLAGVGVAFYVMLALRSRLRQADWFRKRGIQEPNLGQFLDLVALGTVADLVPLDQNNRILVRHGLERVRSSNCRIGLKALLRVSGHDCKNIVTSDLGFVIAPRLNAAGRLDDMSVGVECLLAEDMKKALDLSKTLNDLNTTRREIEHDMQKQAFASLATVELDKNLPAGICIFDPSWHLGVVGILASRIKERVNRPVIVFAAINDEEIKGSGRSLAGLHLRDILSNIAVCHPGLITKFGGHAMAAGLSLYKRDLAMFSQIFADEVNKQLDGQILQTEFLSDGLLLGDDLSLTMAKLLQSVGPWGQGFPEPTFDGVFNILQQKLVGQKHLKMTISLADEPGFICDAINFNIDLNRWPNSRCKKAHLLYRLDVNEYNDRSYLQLVVEHIQEI